LFTIGDYWRSNGHQLFDGRLNGSIAEIVQTISIDTTLKEIALGNDHFVWSR
jgi:hypothetical protein